MNRLEIIGEEKNPHEHEGLVVPVETLLRPLRL